MVRSVLFACNLNSVRSPMAAAMLRAAARGRMRVDSAGVYEGGPDPFIPQILTEIGVALEPYAPKAMGDLDLSDFDLAIVLTPEAAGEARRLMPSAKVEYWPIDNPTDVRGDEAALMSAYRAARDAIAERLQARFPEIYKSP